MVRSIIIFIVGLILVNSLAFGVCNAQNLDQAFGRDSFITDAAELAGYDTSVEDPNPIIQVVITSLLSFLGVIFLILMIYGGFLWMTDRGNTEQVEKAKKLLTAAVVGLIIVISAYAISIFVFESFGNALTNPSSEEAGEESG